jgi:hypothetical protein
MSLNAAARNPALTVGVGLSIGLCGFALGAIVGAAVTQARRDAEARGALPGPRTLVPPLRVRETSDLARRGGASLVPDPLRGIEVEVRERFSRLELDG